MSDSTSATSSPITSPGGGRVARSELRARPAERGALSFGQQRLWFLHRWIDGSPVYHAPAVLTFLGPVDPDRLRDTAWRPWPPGTTCCSRCSPRTAASRGSARSMPVSLTCPVIDLTDRPVDRAARRRPTR